MIAAGRLVAKKGFDVLLDAFREVRRRCDAGLVILGEGPLRSALEAKASALGLADAVALPGFQKNPSAWFARADLFVLSSFAEGMPNAMLQAMASGCPVVATDCPSGPREILEDGRWGTLVPPGDVGALADAIMNGLRAPSPRSLFPGRARVRALSRERAAAYALDPIAEQYVRLLLPSGRGRLARPQPP